MERFCFEDYEAFACAIVDSYKILEDSDDLADVCVVARYDDAKEIVTELICMGYDLFDVHLCNPEIDAYTDEYYISLNSDGVWCERSIGDKGYLYQESGITYILGDCNSSVEKHIGSAAIVEAYVGCCNECDCKNDCDKENTKVGFDTDCNECEFKDECRDMEMTELKGVEEFTEDEIPGFSIMKSDGKSTTSISFYSTDKELVKTMAEFYR